MKFSNTVSLNKLIGFGSLLALSLLPSITMAASLLGGGDGGEIGDAATAIVKFIQGVLIPFLFAIGFFMFVWGIIKFFVIGVNNNEAKASGKSLIINAVAGYVIIFAFWGVVNIVVGGIGIGGENLEGEVEVPGA